MPVLPRKSQNARDGAPSLIELLRPAAGNPPALDPLAATLQGQVRRFLARLAPKVDLDQLDDFTQETLLHVLLRIESCRADTDAGVRAWVFAVARRVILDYNRSNQVALRSTSLEILTERYHRAAEQPTIQDHVAGIDDELTKSITDISVVESSPGAQVETAATTVVPMLASLIVQAQRCLPPDTQELLYRRVIERDTWSEIGGWMHIQAGAAKRRFQRAQRAIRRQLLKDLSNVEEPRRSEAVCWLSSAMSTQAKLNGRSV